MTCPVCGADNEARSAFCDRCGSALKPNSPAAGVTVYLDNDPVAAQEATNGPRIYEAPPQPSSPAAASLPPSPVAASLPSNSFDGASAAPNPGLPAPSFTVPAQGGAAYTVPVGVGTAPEQSNSALISMILGITSLVLFMVLLCVFFLSPLSAVAGIPAVILGRRARREIKASDGRLTGDGMAVAGMVMGWINIGLSVLMLCAIVAFFAALAAGISAS